VQATGSWRRILYRRTATRRTDSTYRAPYRTLASQSEPLEGPHNEGYIPASHALQPKMQALAPSVYNLSSPPGCTALHCTAVCTVNSQLVILPSWLCPLTHPHTKAPKWVSTYAPSCVTPSLISLSPPFTDFLPVLTHYHAIPSSIQFSLFPPTQQKTKKTQ